ncbi:hypothetical protein [Pseudomonas turukhanskensis]|uniref:Flagellar protein FliT n=1 Tax=Pseudomonas turukhanskensis TaxID=1806536 RepID=A0A9W6NHY4_9PSED|nr:hypothetical protein [Pseudomonas turukhanskensis]GLK91362.1 hypothetical protein GCM10017655_44260 [Pseudomonas turukhanskensis]
MPRVERLRLLHERLQQVLLARDWLALGEVDAAIREELQRDVPPSLERQRLQQQLKELHGRAYQACAGECERVRQLMLSHLEYAEGRSAYERVELLQNRS